MSTPVPYGKSIDSEGLFQLEEMEDAYPESASEIEDSDIDGKCHVIFETFVVHYYFLEAVRGDAIHIGRSKSQQINIAKSLPVTIPVFMSPFGGRHTEDDHDDVLVI